MQVLVYLLEELYGSVVTTLFRDSIHISLIKIGKVLY